MIDLIERTFIEENIRKIRIENYLKGELDKAGFTKMEMNKTPLVTRIILSVTRPGLAIGKGGKNIKMLTHTLEQEFGIDNPQIEINEIKTPELDAKATVNKMISLIERGFSWKSVAFRTMDDISKAGAQGVELIMKGKLAGKGGRKMKQRLAKGYMKRAGSLTELVNYAQGDAYPKAGAIGIKLRIIAPGIVFPDKVNLKEHFEKQEEAEKAEAEEKVEDKTEIKVEKKEEEEKEGKEEKVEGKAKEEGKEEKKEEKVEKKDVKEKKEKKEKSKEEEKKDVKKKTSEKKEKKEGKEKKTGKKKETAKKEKKAVKEKKGKKEEKK